MRKITALAIASVVSASAFAQNQNYLGTDVGLYFPTSGALKTALGDQWLSWGLTTMRGGAQKASSGHSWNGVSKSANGNHATILSYSLGSFTPLGNGNASVVPFFAARAGISYIDYRIGVDSGKKFGYNANVEVGIVIQGRLTLSARYDTFSKHDGYTFDGFNVSLRYGILQF